MASRSEMRSDDAVNRKKLLRLLGRLEPSHAPLAFSCWLMGVFGSIIVPGSAFVPAFLGSTRGRAAE